MTQPHPVGRRRLAALALAAALVTPLPFAPPAPAQTTATLSPASITWDQYGIPHIQADSLEGAVRALGYVQMEAHAELLLTNVARARGRAAEYIGVGQYGVNLQSDRFARAVGIPDRAARWLQEGSARQNAILDAFAKGVNEYAQGAGGATISPLLRQVLPVTPADLHGLTLYSIHYTFLTENANVPGQVAAWQAGQSASLVAQGGEGPGSNAFALGPTRTQSRNAILMGNPHLPFGSAVPQQGLELYQWFEAHLLFGDTNAYGATFIGAPFVGIGFNQDLGWTHTNNTIDNADLYEIQLGVQGSYVLDGQVRPLENLRLEDLRVRQPDGSVTLETLTLAGTVHGPIVAFRPDGKALALRVAGLEEEGIVEQYWDMMLSGTLEQFQAAQRRLQMPFFNVMYADRSGKIFYLFGGRQPRRPYGTTDDWDGIIDGTTSATLWTDTLSFEELPQVTNPPAGVLHNCNDPPWTSTFPQVIRAEQYPAWVSPVEMFPRAQHCALALQSQRRFTADEVRRAKMSGRMLLADRVLGDLTKAGHSSTDPAAKRGARVLQTWDRETRADSRGAVLFQRWFELFVADPAAPQGTWRGYPAFDVPWDPAKPLATPRGILDEGRAALALAKAVRELEAQYGTPYVAWGQVNRAILFGRGPEFFPTGPLADLAANGGPGEFGTLRVAYFAPLGDGRGFFVGGDSYVQVVEFAPTGPKARTALTYGNSSRPGSPDITDQLRLYERRELRKVAFTPEEVAAAGVRTVQLPALADGS